METSKLIDKITYTASLYPTKIFTPTNKTKIYTCINPYSYHLLRKKGKLFSLLDGIFVDGILMCWMINLIWNRKIPRLSFDMSSMAAILFEKLNGENKGSIYFIGAKQGEINEAINQIKAAFPQINIIGSRNGYFKNKEERSSEIKRIISLNPDYVVIGMGCPLQEQFSVDLKEAGFKGTAFTCGGFFHQTNGRINYYPEWINKYNLRAFYRLFKERGLFKRLYNVLIQFPILFTYDSVKEKLILFFKN